MRVYDWYFGTINVSATQLLSDTDEAIPRSIWYAPSENGGAACGFVVSRIGGGARPATGLNLDFGGSSDGQPVTRNTATGSQWPNVFNMQVLDSRYAAQNVPQFEIGENLTLQFQYQSFGSQAYASIFLDTDQNPYNGNSINILGALVSCPANGDAINAKTATWNTTGRSPGTYYLYVKIEDGFGHVRYVHAVKPVQLLTQPGSSSATLVATADATVNASWPNSNYGSASYTTMDLSGTMGSRKRALVRFALSSIPAGSTINTVELKLYATLCSNPDAISTCLMSLGGPWSEQWVSASDPGVC